MSEQQSVAIYVVYFDWPEHPGKWTVRRQVASALLGVARVDVDADICASGDTLDEVLAQLPPGLVRIAPQPGDHPSVIEIWL